MKRYISSILALALLFCMAACTAAEQHTSSEALLSSSPEIVSETEMESSETSSYDAVTSINNSSTANTNNTTTSPSTSPSSTAVSSWVITPHVSYGGKTSSELMYINPASEVFFNNEEMVEYLKSTDLREKGWDIIADHNIYLTPRIVESPKSKAAKQGYKSTLVATGKGGKYWLKWSFFNDVNYNDAENCLFYATWYIAKNYQNDSIKTPQDLMDHVKSVFYPGLDLSAEIIERENRLYVLISNQIYWMHEDKYLVAVNNSWNFGNREELILLAEDIVFDKHTLK